MKFSNFMSQEWDFGIPVLSWGRVFVHDDCSGGGFLTLRVVSRDLSQGGWFWIKLKAA